MVGDFVGLVAHDLFLHHILNLFHTSCPIQALTSFCNCLDDLHNLIRCQVLFFFYGAVGFLHCILNLLGFKTHFHAASLYNIHSHALHILYY